MDLQERLNDAAPHFARELAQLACARGLAVTAADGSTRPIPITAAPAVLQDDELERRARLAAQLASAGLKMSQAALRADDQRAVLLSALSPLEAELARATCERLEVLATTRVDFFAGSTLRALELNATIPAMQGYSDIAAECFLEVVGRFAGLPAAAIARLRNGGRSNARALHAALQAGYRRVRPGRAPVRLALLCRRADAQLTELNYLRDRFRAFGTDADVVYPDQLGDDDDAVLADGKRYDLIYRHLFVRRLEEASMVGAERVRRLLAEQNGRRAVVLNPPASQVEVKAVFGLLSLALEDNALARSAGLSDDELAAVDAAVPWTRVLRAPELVAEVAADPDRYVLKRSWDYGGRAVFVGRARHEDAFRARVEAAWPDTLDATLDWPGLCARAARDSRGGGFVVQALVPAHVEPHVVCQQDGAKPAELFVDFSAYASVGIEEDVRWGGVCRGSTSSIVNIMGGGGVVPLITAEAARELEAGLAAVERST